MKEEVSICRDCIHKFQSEHSDSYKNYILNINKMPYCVIEETKTIDFVTGETRTTVTTCTPCREKNKDGTCPDFEMSGEARRNKYLELQRNL